jgi:uncharacterized membrane protein YcaP (DUF421 family)
MDSVLWKLDAPWWHFILRGSLVFGVVLLFLRVSGKRQVGQMTPFDLVLLLLISNAVQNSMNGGDNSITAGIILAASLIAADAFLSYLTRKSRKWETLIEGQALLVVHNGRVLEDALRRSGMTRHDLMAGLRIEGCASLEQVHGAVLETNGRVSVLQRREAK